LTALVAFMKGVCHASFSTIRKFLRDVVRVDVSRGYLAKLIHKVSLSLAPAYAELFERLPSEAVLNIDETGHKENGQKFWTWCFRAQRYTLFRIDKSRGSKVLVEVLGEEFNSVLGCDYFSAPQVHAGVQRAGAVLHGPPDPRREVPADAPRTRCPGLRQRLRDAPALVIAVRLLTASRFPTPRRVLRSPCAPRERSQEKKQS
jgi:hypothetical protein